MKAIPTMIACLLIPLSAQAQTEGSADVRHRSGQLGIGGGYVSRQLLDAQKSALVYISSEYQGSVFFRNEKDRSVFSTSLDFSMGTYDAKHFRGRTLFMTSYDMEGNASKDSFTLFSGIMAGTLQASYFRKVAGTGNVRWFAGASLQDMAVYPENNIGLLNSLSLDAGFQMLANLGERQTLHAQLTFPVVALNTRLPWHNTATDPVAPEMKTFFKTGTRLVTVNNFQRFSWQVNYSRRLSDRWNLGAGFAFAWLRVPYYQPMKSFVSNFKLFTSYQF
jgi:hypothetical protein